MSLTMPTLFQSDLTWLSLTWFEMDPTRLVLMWTRLYSTSYGSNTTRSDMGLTWLGSMLV